MPRSKKSTLIRRANLLKGVPNLKKYYLDRSCKLYLENKTYQTRANLLKENEKSEVKDNFENDDIGMECEVFDKIREYDIDKKKKNENKILATQYANKMITNILKLKKSVSTHNMTDEERVEYEQTIIDTFVGNHYNVNNINTANSFIVSMDRMCAWIGVGQHRFCAEFSIPSKRVMEDLKGKSDLASEKFAVIHFAKRSFIQTLEISQGWEYYHGTTSLGQFIPNYLVIKFLCTYYNLHRNTYGHFVSFYGKPSDIV